MTGSNMEEAAPSGAAPARDGEDGGAPISVKLTVELLLGASWFDHDMSAERGDYSDLFRDEYRRFSTVIVHEMEEHYPRLAKLLDEDESIEDGEVRARLTVDVYGERDSTDVAWGQWSPPPPRTEDEKRDDERRGEELRRRVRDTFPPLGQRLRVVREVGL